jgi:hypothetical protein
MTGKAQRKGGFGLLLAVAVGRSVAECAAVGNVSEVTVRRRMRDPKFMNKVRELQRQMTALAAGKVVSSLDQAIETMKGLLASPNDSVKLGAASRIAALSMQMGEMSDLQAKVARLEDLLTKLKGGRDEAQ